MDIFLIPRNHSDKLWFTFSEEVIVKFQYFFQKFTKHSTFDLKDGYVLVSVKISYYHKNMPYCNPRARRANVQDAKAKCVNVVGGSHVCGFAWCWTEAVSRE